MPHIVIPGTIPPDAALVPGNSLPELRAGEQGLRAQAAREGISYVIAPFGGPLRTQADTTNILRYRAADYAAYVARQKAAGRAVVDIDTFRRVAPFGLSFHNYGAAFDINIDTWPTGMTADQALTHVGAMAAAHGLRWGAAFGDTPHFELAKTLEQVKAAWQAYSRPPTLADASSLPGVQIIAPGVVPVMLPTRVAAVVSKLPVPTAVKVAAARHPLATTAVSTGALVVAGLLVYLAVQRFLD